MFPYWILIIGTRARIGLACEPYMILSVWSKTGSRENIKAANYDLSRYNHLRAIITEVVWPH